MGLKDVLKSIKKAKKYDLRCPVCGSKDIIRIHKDTWLLPNYFICTNCKYEGYILVEYYE